MASKPVSSQEKFLPYGRQVIDEADIEAVVRVLRSDYLTTGPEVEAFERALAKKVGARFAVALCNGTAALHAACFAADIGPDDNVIVPAITFLATANCVRYVGSEPVFVDVSPTSGLVEPEHIERRLEKTTKAVIPVHLTGRPVDLAPIAKAAQSKGAIVIEDAAHALGASYRGETIGSCRYSDMTVFSFHPVKHVTTGEGGAVTTNDEGLARRLRLFRNHGMVHDQAELQRTSPGPWYYEQHALGFNYRITDIQCALGSSQLAKLDGFIERRRDIAAQYDQLLESVDGVTPIDGGVEGANSAYHLYSVLMDFDGLGLTRAEVMVALRERGVGSQVHYIPVPSQPYYEARGWRADDFPGALSYSAHTLSLPMFPSMSDRDIAQVVDALGEVLDG